MGEQKYSDTQGEFDHAFDQKYITVTIMSIKRAKFLILDKGDISVTKYKQKLLDLQTFASDMSLSEEANTNMFNDHLNQVHGHS